MHVSVSQDRGSAPGTVRLTGHVHSTAIERDVWFELPEDSVVGAPSGAAWLLTMLPLAVRTGETIELDLPVDALFLENIKGLAETWRHWYPELKGIEIRAPIAPAPATEGHTAQFFSGGVDSWFTLLRHTESTARFPQIGAVDDLITVWGFDIPLDAPSEFAELAESVAEIAEAYGKRSIVVSTNLRDRMEGPWRDVWGPRWGSLSHGTALAAVALHMPRRYGTVKIASTHRFWEPFPFGSHPMTDPLFSSSATTFLHDHALYSRTDKTERIAESDFAMSKLKVCYAEGKFRNCSQCVKCHRMLLSFDALGILDKAKSFDLGIYEKNRGRPFMIVTENDHVRAWEVRELALKCKRPDIAGVIDESLRRSRTAKLITRGLQKVSWRAWENVYKRAAGDMIGA